MGKERRGGTCNSKCTETCTVVAVCTLLTHYDGHHSLLLPPSSSLLFSPFPASPPIPLFLPLPPFSPFPASPPAPSPPIPLFLPTPPHTTHTYVASSGTGSDSRPVEELLAFIQGDEQEAQTSSKAAKRQRRKMKKVDVAM